jgi:RNA polymerase II subunit A small phosphatase-like protein
MTAPLLILDLDETLIFGTRTPLSHPPDLEHGGWCIYHRPHLAEFIEQVRTAIELAVWTSATESYADLVVGTAFPPDLPFAFVWSRARCTWRHHPETREEYWLKNLRKVERLGYDLDRVLMVDDEAVKLERNYGNHIPIAPFTGASDDSKLPLLARYLLSVSTRPNLRAIEKRRWRSDPGVAAS